MWKTAKLVRIHLAPTEITRGHCKLTPMLKTLKTYYNLQESSIVPVTDKWGRRIRALGKKRDVKHETLTIYSYEVLFEVRVRTEPGERVCVAGDVWELGKWNPHKAIKLQLKSKKQAGSSVESRSDSEGDLWSKKVKVSSDLSLQFRYFTCRVFQSDNEEEDESIIVTRWETNLKPRTFSLQDALKNKKKTEEAASVFGEYGGKCNITPGWLIDQTQITINLHNNPIKMWNTKSRSQLYRIKCTPLDHRFRDEEGEEDSTPIPMANNMSCSVSVLEKGMSIPCQQSNYGSLYKQDDFVCFMIQTLEPENTGFQLDFYAEPEDEEKLPSHIGYTFILPFDLRRSRDFKTLPITSCKHKPLGQIKIDYLLVKPMITERFDMAACYLKNWNPTTKPLDIAHRGMGVSYSDNFYKTLSSTRENTVQSMKDAFEHGADYVELDVHLTKDKEVIVYHDFKIYITYRKKKQGEHQLMSVPVKELLLSELQSMKLSHTAKPANEDDIVKEDLDPQDQQPFPTLQQCLEAVDTHCGFNVEIKYPQPMMDGSHEQDNYFDLNECIDKILRVIFQYHNGRRIIFSSFDCDTCVALRLKQNRFPVLFLTQADTPAYVLYQDKRTQSIKMAAEFALANGLLGVNAMSQLLLNDMSLIDYVKDSGLVLFCWGEDNNNTEVINLLKQRKLDAVIYDRIDYFKTPGKQNVFKMEHMEKVAALNGFQSPMTSEPLEVILDGEVFKLTDLPVNQSRSENGF